MRARLGDVIDDYCVKCKRIMNHSVVSCVNDEPAKVRCRTCHGDHDYRHEIAPPTKADLRKAALFKEVSDRMGVTSGEEAPAPVEAEADGATSAEPEVLAPAKAKRAKAKKSF